MTKKYPKRLMAAALAVATLLTGIPAMQLTASAAEEDDQASAAVISVGDTYQVADPSVQEATFLMSGRGRNVWPMFTKLNDGTEIHAYCADHSKADPGPSGKTYTVTNRVSDMRLVGVLMRSDARNTLNSFITLAGAPVSAANFNENMFFSASQVAVWAALGDVTIQPGSINGVSWPGSVALGYPASGGAVTATNTTEALTLFAACRMLQYGNDFNAVWGPNGVGHAPWIGAEINYTPGNATYNAANKQTGSINVGDSIVGSGVFAEKTIDGTDYLVLPMAAAAATFVRGQRIFVSAKDMPTGAFLMTNDGKKSVVVEGAHNLTLNNAKSDDTLYQNGNGKSWGETFLFCIPKATAESMDTAGQKLNTSFQMSANVDRYNAFLASTNSSGIQPVLLVEPAVQLVGAKVAFSPDVPMLESVDIKLLKTDEDGAGLEGCTFTVSYAEDGANKTKTGTSDSNGEISFENLPLNTEVTIKETDAPEGYTLLPDKVINTGNKGGQVATYTFANSDDHVFKIKKKSTADGRNLMGATFEIKGINNSYVNTFTTNGMGEIEINGRDLPNGSYQVYEIAAPEGYVTDGADIQTFEWDNSRDVELTFKNAPQPSIVINKFDKDTLTPLSGATFEIRKDGQVLQTVKTDVNGKASMTNLTKGFYQVVEVEAPAGYLKDEVVHEVYIDPTADPTQLIREVNVSNTKKLSLRIVKIDKDTKVPLKGWKFDVFYNDAHITSVMTDDNGEAMLDNLQPGTYRVSETGGDTEHYNMDAPDQTVEIIKDQTEIPTLTFENTIKKHFGIYKIDAETHRPIQGVTFEIWRDGKLLGNYTTDENGRIWLPYAEPGTYQAKETVTDPKYVLNETTFTIENNAEYPTFFTIPNVMKKDITVSKIDKDSGLPLQGVVFEGFRDGKSIGYFTTGADGKFTIPYAPNGTYIFKEYHTLAGYELNREPIVIEHTTDGNSDIVVDNTQQKDFTVVKIDSQTKQPLAGVQFKIWRDGLLLGDYITDADGKITIEKAPAGTYKVQEVKTLTDYLLNDTPLEIEHTTAKPTVQTIENTKRPGISILKIDAATKKPLANAVFSLKKADGDMVYEDLRTDADGKIQITNLDSGSYIITEIKAPDGYIIDDTPKTITVEDGKTYSLTYENTRRPGLLIKKVDSETGKALSGARFKVTRGDGSVVLEDGVTDAYGTLHLPELDTGTYIVTEIKAPDGYVIDDMPKTVELRAGETYTVTFENTKKSGVTLKKIDEDTRQPLKNALFKITKANGELVKEAETDVDGVISLDELPAGSYVITEIKAPDGYILQDAPKTVEIKDGGSYEFVFTNKRAYGLQIRKTVSGTGEALAGAKFTVEKATGERVGTFTTNSAGIVNVTGLEDGVYVVTEISAPEGYRLDTTPQNVIVKAGEMATVEFENEELSSIRIKKIDAVTRKGIYGVRFLIKDSRNNIVGEYTTDQDGYIELEDELSDGKYKVEEIKAADGYVLDEEVKTIRVKRGETTELVWENVPIVGQIQIVKKSAEDNALTNLAAGSLLSGAVFEITNADTGVVADTVTSDNRGVAASRPLPLGRYFVQEITAPKYYQLNSAKAEVRLKVEGDVVQVEVYNNASHLDVTVKKTSNKAVSSGSNMRYDFSQIANNSNVSLESFYFHDRIPTDAVRGISITTGQYSHRVWYSIKYKTNLNDYRVLANNLQSTNSYQFKISADSLGLLANEYVTDFRYEFGTVPAGFKSTVNPTLYVNVPSYIRSGSIINRCDVGGKYQGEWETGTSTWVTSVISTPTPNIKKLPQTGY